MPLFFNCQHGGDAEIPLCIAQPSTWCFRISIYDEGRHSCSHKPFSKPENPKPKEPLKEPEIRFLAVYNKPYRNPLNEAPIGTLNPKPNRNTKRSRQPDFCRLPLFNRSLIGTPCKSLERFKLNPQVFLDLQTNAIDPEFCRLPPYRRTPEEALK